MFNFFKNIFVKKQPQKIDASEVIVEEIKKIKKELIIHKRYNCNSQIAENLLCLKLLLSLLKTIDKEKWSSEYEELKDEFTN